MQILLLQTKLKFSDAKQAIYNYKNIKRKLYRTNAAIWYNKICRQKQLTPSYINNRIKKKVCSNKICILLHHVGVLFNLILWFTETQN